MDSSKGNATLNLTIGDSLKAAAGKYDSIQIRVIVLSGTDTSYNKIIFDGAYNNPAQLQGLNLGKIPSNDYTIILYAYRQGAVVLVIELPFNDGKAGTSKIDTLILPDTTTQHVMNSLRMWLAPPDSGLASLPIKEGATLAFQVMAEDSIAKDTAVLLHFVNPLPTICGNPSYDTTSGAFSFKPTFACVDSGGDSVSATLQFIAKDKISPPLYDTLKLSLVVLDSNSAPKWKEDTVNNLSDKQGKPFTLALDSLYLGDAEGDSVSFTASLETISPNPLTWNFTPSFSDSGFKTITLTATDHHHPPASSSLTLKFAIQDSTRAFNVIITSPPNGYVTRDSVITVHWSVNGANQATDTTEHLTQGLNSIGRSYRDTLTGIVYSDTITVTRDNTPPNKPLVHAATPTNNPTPTWTWESGGGGGDGNFRHRLDSASFTDTVGTKDTSFTPSANLAAGTHTLYVEERDDAGNWSSMAADSVQIVLTGPLVTITSPPNNYVTRQASVNVSWTVNGVAQAVVNKSLSEGANTLSVVGSDAAGNKDTASITVTRDTVPPNKPVVTGPGLTNKLMPTWTWHSGGNGGSGYYRYKIDTSSLADTLGVNDSSYTPTTNLPEGRHVLYIEERDGAGNWSAMDSSGIARIDITPPVVVITSPPDSFVTNQDSVKIQWSADGVAQSALTVNLSEGVNTIKDSATDSAGNVGRASITVTRKSNVLFVNAAASNNNGDGNSWTSAYKYLQTALARSASGQQIWVAKGSYKPALGLVGIDTNTFDTSFVMKSGVIWLGGFKGTENDSGKRDWTNNQTILTGERGNPNDSTDNLGLIITGANNATIDGFVVEKGYSPGSGFAMGNNGFSPQIINCVFQNISNEDAIDIEGSAPTINNSSFINNALGQASALYIANASPTIDRCLFANNIEGGVGVGVAIYSLGSSVITINSSIFENNQSDFYGGAIFGSASLTISNSIFIGNRAFAGGAIYTNGTSYFTNDVFVQNVGSNLGGAVYLNTTGSFTNCTFFGNGSTSTLGGAIYSSENLIIQNSILFGDIGNEGSEVFIDQYKGVTVSINYSDLAGGVESIVGDTTTGVYVTGIPVTSNNNLTGNPNPKFKNPASAAGPDGKYFTSDDGFNLSSGSPCINTGDPSTTGLPSTDITGAARVQSGTVDMGAYEQ